MFVLILHSVLQHSDMLVFKSVFHYYRVIVVVVVFVVVVSYNFVLSLEVGCLGSGRCLRHLMFKLCCKVFIV